MRKRCRYAPEMIPGRVIHRRRSMPGQSNRAIRAARIKIRRATAEASTQTENESRSMYT